MRTAFKTILAIINVILSVWKRPQKNCQFYQNKYLVRLVSSAEALKEINQSHLVFKKVGLTVLL